MKPWLKNRRETSAYSNILQELRLQDQEEFRKYLRMNTDTYTVIFSIRNILEHTRVSQKALIWFLSKFAPILLCLQKMSPRKHMRSNLYDVIVSRHLNDVFPNSVILFRMYDFLSIFECLCFCAFHQPRFSFKTKI